MVILISKKLKWIARLLLLGIAIALYFAHQVPPFQIESLFESTPQVCPLKRFTGLLCAFCGMTHAWVAIARGEWAEATHDNLLAIPVFFIAVMSLTSLAFGYGVELSRNQKRIGTMMVVVILVGYGVMRNFG